MEHPRTSVAPNTSFKETDMPSQMELSGYPQWHLLSPQEWMQLARLAQRLPTLLDRLLALQTMARCRSYGDSDANPA